MKRALVLLFALMLVFAAPAAAHVTVASPGATRGGTDQEITFRVPTEEDQATVGLTVQLPTDTPIAGVDVEAIPDWTSTQKMTKLAKPITTDDGEITQVVSEITWKATAGGIPPQEFGRFTIIAGLLPDADSLTFRALQTYADGSVVRWIETASPGSDEPDHPAPVLTLSTAPATAPSAASSTATSTASSTATKDDDPNTTLPTVLSIVALVLAAGALGVVVLRRRRI